MPLTPSELRAMLREDYGAFFRAMNPRLKLGKFQREIVFPAVSRFEKGEWQKLCILLPPNHGKTSAITVPMPQFRMGNRPDKTVMLLSYSNDLAHDFGLRIKTGIMSKNFKSIFPSFALQPGARAKNFFRTMEGGSFYAIGLSGSVEGKRADLLVIDDPIGTAQEARSDTQMQNLKLTYDTVVKNRLNAMGQILLITTRWCINDFYDRLMEAEGETWKVLTLPAEPDPDNRPGEYLWPEMYSPEHYEDRKIEQESWNAKFQQAPQRGQGPWFKTRNWILWYEHPVKPGKYNTYMLIDPALKKTSSSDRTSIMVIMCAPPIEPSQDPAFILADWTLDRLDPAERQNEIIRLCKKWRPIKIGYEEYGHISDSFHLDEALKRNYINVDVVPLGRSGPTHRLSKEERIGNLIPLFRRGQIVMPRQMVQRLVNGDRMDLIQYFLENEYDKYAGKGTVRHDDALDTLSRVLETDMYFDHRVPGRKTEMEYEPAPSWTVNY